MTTDKETYDFGSDASYGKGNRAMKNELGVQLQKLANQGYLILNIIHAEDKVDFATQKPYIGTSLSNSLYGVAEKFVDQIVYLRRDENKNTGKIEHRIWFNSKGGFPGAGGRWTPEVDSVECSYANLEKVMLDTIAKDAAKKGVQATALSGPSVTIQTDEYDFIALKKEFQALTDKLANSSGDAPLKIKSCIESILGAGKKASDLGPAQAELLADVIAKIKETFKLNAPPAPAPAQSPRKTEPAKEETTTQEE